jgi:class 3 adenylate cyclase
LPVLSIGTGINTGRVTVGWMGSDEQGNYTVFAVGGMNSMSRLETGVGARANHHQRIDAGGNHPAMIRSQLVRAKPAGMKGI